MLSEFDRIKLQVTQDTQKAINTGREMQQPNFSSYDESITEVEGIKPEDVPGLNRQ